MFMNHNHVKAIDNSFWSEHLIKYLLQRKFWRALNNSGKTISCSVLMLVYWKCNFYMREKGGNRGWRLSGKIINEATFKNKLNISFF